MSKLNDSRIFNLQFWMIVVLSNFYSDQNRICLWFYLKRQSVATTFRFSSLVKLKKYLQWQEWMQSKVKFLVFRTKICGYC